VHRRYAGGRGTRGGGGGRWAGWCMVAGPATPAGALREDAARRAALATDTADVMREAGTLRATISRAGRAAAAAAEVALTRYSAALPSPDATLLPGVQRDAEEAEAAAHEARLAAAPRWPPPTNFPAGETGMRAFRLITAGDVESLRALFAAQDVSLDMVEPSTCQTGLMRAAYLNQVDIVRVRSGRGSRVGWGRGGGRGRKLRLWRLSPMAGVQSGRGQVWRCAVGKGGTGACAGPPPLHRRPPSGRCEPTAGVIVPFTSMGGGRVAWRITLHDCHPVFPINNSPSRLTTTRRLPRAPPSGILRAPSQPWHPMDLTHSLPHVSHVTSHAAVREQRREREQGVGQRQHGAALRLPEPADLGPH
jgi:hypothetical protein